MSADAAYPVADLERRFHAFVVDRLVDFGVAVALAAVLWVLTEDPVLVAGVGLGVLVALWLVLAVSTGVAGVTPGKAALQLRVVSAEGGEPVGIGKALVRSLVLALSGLPTFGFGLAALAWTAVADQSGQRRGWHDLVTGSVVLDVREVPEEVAADADDTPRHVVNLTAMRLVPAPAANVPAARRTVPDSEHSMRREPLAKDLSGPGTGSHPVVGSRTTQRVVPGAPAAGAVDHSPRAAVPPPAQPVAQQARHAPPAPARPPAAHQPPAPQPPAPQPPVPQPPVPTPVPGPPPTAAPAQPQLPPGSARWRATFDDGQSFVVEGIALVGRRPTPGPGEQVRHLVPLSSPEMSVSKTHAHFGPAPDGVIVVTDRGSTNGTILIRSGIGRQLSPGKPATLRDGDRVMFGDRAMTLSLEG